MDRFKPLILTALFVLCSFPLAACYAQDTEQIDRMELEKDAVTAFKAYASLLRQSKFDESVAYYADDPRFVWVEDGGIKYDSKNQIRRALEAVASQGVVVSNFGLPTVWALNDSQVMVFAKFRTTIAKGSPDEFTFAGAITAVMEKRAEGWQFLSGHTSSAPTTNGF